VTSDSPKGYYPEDDQLVTWIVIDGDPKEPSVECQIMDWADDIAYSVHDLEDGLHAGLITPRRMRRYQGEIMEAASKEASRKHGLSLTSELFDKVLKQLEKDYEAYLEPPYKEKDRKAVRKALTSALIAEFIDASSLEKSTIKAISKRYAYRLKVADNQRLKCIMLKNIAWVLMINDERILALRVKADYIIRQLFAGFYSNKNLNISGLLPDDYEEMYKKDAGDKASQARVVADFISGMTDEYAQRVYAALYSPGSPPMFGVY